MSRRMNVRAAVVPAAGSTMMAELLFTALAPLDPPTPIDCSPYAGVSQALQGAAEHISAPQATPGPPNPAVRTTAPVHCG
jgi:hypothetical protein